MKNIEQQKKSLNLVDVELLLEKSIAFVDPFLTEEFGK